MILCKFSKVDAAIFTPHLDILRAVTMAIRRTGLQIEYSAGFNPHMQLYFNQPLPLGVASECEYFCAYSSENAEKFKDSLNSSLPSGIRILRCVNVAADPNVAKNMYAALYEVTMREHSENLAKITEVLQKSEYTISYTAKGNCETKQVRDMILDIRVSLDTVYLTLRCGNVNLRAERLMDNLLRDYCVAGKYDVVKKEMFAESGKNLDEIF